jgi:phosphoserine phosphatase
MTRPMSEVLTLIAPAGSGALTDALIARAADAGRAGPPPVLSPNEAVELTAAAPIDAAAVDAALAGSAVDWAITPALLRRKRLLIADMDSTIVTGETLDELAAFAGVGERVAAITKRSMNGELDFSAALRERVALLEGLAVGALEQTWAGVRLTPGARTLVQTMRANGAMTALVSGGFTWFTGRVAAQCGFHVHRANTLLDDGAVLLGRVTDPILDRDAKLAALVELATAHGVGLEECLAVGDGANDLAMIRAAGLGVAYRAKPIVAAEAQARVVHGDLRSLLFMQGYAADEFVP